MKSLVKIMEILEEVLMIFHASVLTQVTYSVLIVDQMISPL